jgi:hypothetical protein
VKIVSPESIFLRGSPVDLAGKPDRLVKKGQIRLGNLSSFKSAINQKGSDFLSRFPANDSLRTSGWATSVAFQRPFYNEDGSAQHLLWLQMADSIKEQNGFAGRKHPREKNA